MQGDAPPTLYGEAGALTARWLLFHAQAQGFFSCAVLGKQEWERVLLERGFAEDEGGAERGAESSRARASQMVRARYGLDSAGAMLVVALCYAPDVAPEPAAARAGRGLPPLPLPEPGKPVATIGRFARGNWYGEIGARLAACAAATAAEMAAAGMPRFPPKRWQRFSNSRFPEKALAVAAGLGTIGRNGLFIAEAPCSGGGQAQGSAAGGNRLRGDVVRAKAPSAGASSAVLLGLLLLPFDIETASIPPRRPPMLPLSRCGNCRRCVDACPTKALQFGPQPAFERERCVQYYSSRAGALPAFIEASWQDQLYGCDLCLEACPYFRPDAEARTDRGMIGGALDAASIAGMDDGQLRALLKGTSLDQKWIEPGALRRNAALALRKSKAPRDAQ